MGVKLLDPLLYLRWVQFGALSPVFRFHSAPDAGSRLPWDYGERIERNATRWLRIRHSLLPHLYTAARQHHDTGVPLVRGMFLDAPGDERSYRFDQYFLGENLLVAPVLDSNPIREVYFPPGDWYEFESSQRIAGNSEQTIAPSVGKVPLYVRAGGLLVRQQQDESPVAGHVEKLLLDVYPAPNDSVNQAHLYEDDGRSSAYRHGGLLSEPFRPDEPAQRLFTGSVCDRRPAAGR